jgi:hypothetical protein
MEKAANLSKKVPPVVTRSFYPLQLESWLSLLGREEDQFQASVPAPNGKLEWQSWG